MKPVPGDKVVPLAVVPPAGVSDVELVRQSLENPEVFGQLFERHGPVISGYLRRRLGDGSDGLTGEVFTIAFDKRDRFVDQRSGSARPWLYGIASNLVRSHYRKEERRLRALAKLRQQAVVDDVFERVEDKLAAQDRLSAVLAILETLTTNEREVLVLSGWEELNHADVAAALSIPVGTVKSRLSRARQKIRERLSDCEHQKVTTPHQSPTKEQR